MLTNDDKKENRAKALKRIFVEHINAKNKDISNIKTGIYKQAKKYNLQVNLICGLINFDREIYG